MKKLAFITIITLISFNLFSFTAAFLADSRGNMPPGINGPILGKILKQIQKTKVDAVIYPGDFFSGSKKNPTAHKEQIQNFLSYIKILKDKDVIFSKGNHEGLKQWQDELYKKNFLPPKGAVCLNDPKYYPTVFYKEYSDAVVFSLNCENPGERHIFSDKQIKFFLDNVGKFQNKLIIVAAHEPAYPYGPHKGSSLDKYPQKRDYYWSLFREHGVAIYSCGHEHLYNDKIVGGILQLLTGSCGAPLYNAPSSAKFYQWVLMNYDNKTKIGDFTVYDENGKVKRKFKVDFNKRIYLNSQKQEVKNKTAIPVYNSDKR